MCDQKKVVHFARVCMMAQGVFAIDISIVIIQTGSYQK